MAEYSTKVKVGRKVASFPLDGAGSVHLAQHTLLKLIPKLKLQTGKKVKGQIIRNKIVIFNA